jgi:hypothetical protein
MVIQGRCHCGNIGFELTWDPHPVEIPARACGCSFCVKHGAVWTSNPRGALKVTVEDRALVSRYAFGSETAEFHICSRCGVVPVVTSTIDANLYAVVNVNTFQGTDASLVKRAASDFEGEEQGSRLARRKRNWIGSVEFVERTN